MSNSASVSSLTPVQAANARAIIAVGKASGFPEKAWVVALITAMQESNLGADPTSFRPNRDGDAGVFQQRTLPGWYGTLEQVNNINYSANVFYNGKTLTASDVRGAKRPAGGIGYTIPGLKQIKGWQAMPPTAAAQAVQRSAFPGAYAKHEPKARAIVAAYAGATDSLDTSPPITGGTGGTPAAPPVNPFNFKRIAYALIGIALIVIGLLRLTGADDYLAPIIKLVATKGLIK